MDRFVYLNGKIIGRSAASIAALSSAALYGKGVFTTLSIVDAKPFLWSKHWLRLSANAGTIGLDLSGHSESSARSALDELIAANGMVSGRARLAFSDERETAIWPHAHEGRTSLSIITGEPRKASENLRLTISPYPVNSRSPLAGVKSCNYLENTLSIDEAKKRGFDEAIRVNERGIVTSACMANIFWLKYGRLYTPPLSTGCLPGTTRDYILESIDCDEVEAGIDEVNSANAVFLTSAGLGVVAVKEVEGRLLAGSRHQILRLIDDVRRKHDR